MKLFLFPQTVRLRNMRKKAEAQQYEAVCNYAFVFGQKHYRMDCRNRHLLLECDILPEPMVHHMQMMRFQLRRLHSPTEFMIQPLEARFADGWRSINSSDKFKFDFELRLIEYYRIRCNRHMQDDFTIGDLSVTFIGDLGATALPYRCEIIKRLNKM